MSKNVERARERVKQLRAYDAAAVADDSGVDCSLAECKTQQQFKEDCDVTTIMRRYGGLPEVPVMNEGLYGDFTGISDYESALEKISEVQERFMQLHPEIRERFENDPARLVAEAARMSDSELDSLTPAASEGAPAGTEPGAGAPPPPAPAAPGGE